MARPGLRPELRAALHEAVTTKAEVVRAAVADGGGKEHPVTLIVRPFVEAGAEAGLYMVVFREPEAAVPTPAQPREARPIIQYLEAELRSTREQLRATAEELRWARGRDEELSGLRGRVEELDHLLASTDLPLVFLDRALRVVRYTPAATGVFRLLESDVGRPITDITSRVAYPGLGQDVQTVLATAAPLEREVPATEGAGHYVVRLRPFRMRAGATDGVALTFLDVTDLKLAEDRSRRREEQFRRALEEAPIPVAVYREDGRFDLVNRAFLELTGYAPGTRRAPSPGCSTCPGGWTRASSTSAPRPAGSASGTSTPPRSAAPATASAR
jgi:two-component system CheB/CheR fusion protein